ncbi:DUF456 domain-containing protein [bacterium]|nr:DUF456 domain-containing protein [bacterium]
MWGTIGSIFFWIILVIGVGLIPFGLAGTFLIVLAAFVYGLITGFAEISMGFILVLLSMAVGMELLESLMGAILAKKFGGSKWGMAGAFMGGLIGAVLATPVWPILGTLVGGFLGSFLGAASFEFVHRRRTGHAFRVGAGAFLGALGSKITKIMVAVIMLVLIGNRLI